MFLKEGVGAGALADAVKGYLLRLKQQWSANPNLTAYLADGLYENRTFDYYARLEKKISDLTPERVNEAFRKHIQLRRLVVIWAGDFKKSSQGDNNPRK